LSVDATRVCRSVEQIEPALAVNYWPFPRLCDRRLTADGTVAHRLADAEGITGYSETEMLGQDFPVLFTEVE